MATTDELKKAYTGEGTTSPDTGNAQVSQQAVQAYQQATPQAAQASPASVPATTPVTYVENGVARQGVADTERLPNYYDAMKQYYQQMYDEQTGANNAAAAAAAEQARQATQEQIDALNAGYQGTNRQLYRDYMERQRTLPEQLAAQGYTGGLTESSRLRMGNAYQEALAENERARLSEERGANAALSQQLFESRMATDQANQQARQQQLAYLAALEGQQYQEQQQRADMLAASGDFSGYLGLGYSQGEVDYLTRLWLAQNPNMLNTWISAHPDEAARLGIKKKSSGKKSSGRGGGGNSQTAEDLLNSAYNSVRNGAASTADVAAGIAQAVSQGAISQAQANAINSAAQQGANERAAIRNQAAANQTRDRQAQGL